MLSWFVARRVKKVRGAQSGYSFRSRTFRFAPLTLERLEDRTVPTTFTVTNISNAGAGSLRQAILNANSNPNVGGPDVITFNIGSGIQSIKPTSNLPDFIEPAIVDGASQPGYAGTPIIELDGSLAGPTAN